MQQQDVIRRQTHKTLMDKNIPLHTHLPLLGKTAIRQAHDVADKVISLYCVAGIANGANGEMMLDWLRSEKSISSLEPDELQILSRKGHAKEQMNELSWRQESLYVLCWALSVTNDLAWPSQACNLEPLFASMPPEVAIVNFKKSAKLRSDRVIIEQLDLYYNIHASLCHSELWAGHRGVKELKIEVVEERRHALEWLCKAGVPWADITLDT